MQVLRVEGLPEGALEAAAVFHAEWLGRARDLPNPPPLGEVAARSADGGDMAQTQAPSASLRSAPPPKGEDLVLILSPADHTHRAWRLAAVQGLARELAPLRVNAVASNDPAAIASALAYLEAAPGLTGQYLPLDGIGAGDVIASA
jgi:hypothetical protein